VREELSQVRGAFEAVYTNDTAEHFHDYVRHLCSPSFRECLVTSSDALPAYCRCPHLTKYVFALWVAGAWSAPELRRRQLALLVELFHRSGRTLAWCCPLQLEPEQWLAQRAPPRGNILRHATLSEAQRARRAELEAALAGAPAYSLFAAVVLDEDAVERTCHYQFSVASVAAMFRGLGGLCGAQDYSGETSPDRLALLLSVSEERDNLKRSADPRYTRVMPPEEVLRRGARVGIRSFTQAVLAAEEAALPDAYAAAAVVVHGVGPATVFFPEFVARFRARHGVDLGEVYGLSAAGLPTNACCLAGCPLYLRPLGRPRGAGLHRRLRAHLEPVGVVPALHKTIQSLRQAAALERATVDDVLGCARVVTELVRSGNCLDWRPLSTRPLEEQIRLLEAREDGGPSWPARRDSIIEALRSRIEAATRDNSDRLNRCVSSTIDRHFGGDPAWLEAYVASLLRGYTAGAEGACYRSFEAAVLGAMRCPSTGRLLPVRP
jgi:hypothetical protein